jgi:hypothetical protein
MIGFAREDGGLTGSAGALAAGGQNVDAGCLHGIEHTGTLCHRDHRAGTGQFHLEGFVPNRCATLLGHEPFGAQLPGRPTGAE